MRRNVRAIVVGGGGMRKRTGILGATALLLVACARDPSVSAPRIPVDALPGTVSRAATLGVDEVARDAVRVGELAHVLSDAGFVAASERTYTGERGDGSVTARVLAFSSPSGATAYLAWLRANAEDVIGEVETRRVAIGGADVPAFEHLPGGCCTKETPAYLVGWRDGSRAVTVEVAGPHATLDDLEADAGRIAQALA